MKTKILLLDESVTVQKVVALTLDKNLYTVEFAKTRSEAKNLLAAGATRLVLVSEQVSDLNVAGFPSEVATWTNSKPVIVLITTQDIDSYPNYTAVLRKPFSPQTLQETVAAHTQASATSAPKKDEGFETSSLESAFNKKFSDEEELVRETLDEAHLFSARPAQQAESWTTAPAANPTQSLWGGAQPYRTPVFPTPQPRPEAPASGAALWQSQGQPTQTQRPAPVPQPPQAAPSAPQTSASHAGLPGEDELRQRIDVLLAKIVPPIVERMVKERLDKLLEENAVKDPLADLKS
ncbi:MAG: hypothetical protein KDD39_01380 [Bdellovibrionales bacterium]|nr:hypothetical protein [Bdellovibrionales bacterium]